MIAAPFVRDDPRTVTLAPPVGKIEDAVYQRIGALLAAPPTLHASSFMDRYGEAVREFRERQSAPPPASPNPPPPTDEELGAYNAALHAWLDNDMRRLATLQQPEARDYGGMEMRYASSGGLEQLLGMTSDAFARPGLPALNKLQPQPGLREGFAELSG